MRICRQTSSAPYLRLALLLLLSGTALRGLEADPAERADILHRSGEYREEYELLLSAYGDDANGDGEILLRLARAGAALGKSLLRDGERSDEALLYLSRGEAYAALALERLPGHYLGYYWRACNRFAAADSRGLLTTIDSAAGIRDDLEKAVIANPNHADSWMLLGVLYRRLPGLISFGNIDYAVSLGRRAVALAAGDGYEAYLELARSLYRRDWSARKRSEEIAAKAYQYERRASLLESGWFFEGTLDFSAVPEYADRPLRELSDREEALALLARVEGAVDAGQPRDELLLQRTAPLLR